jgi:thiosulfate/3-mercaptopyruvate sulfurtransferase
MNLLIDCQELAQPAAAGSARVILDCRSDILKPEWGRSDFRAAHIPGARFADVNDDLSGPRQPGSGRHPLPDPQRFAAWLGAQGVDADTWVIACDQGPGAYAARLWWLLRALGHTRVRVLNGGFAAWRAAGLPVTDATPATPAPRLYPARAFGGWLTTAAVEAALASDGILLVDARAADRFAGRNETIDPVAGHVPGAVSKPFMTNLDAEGRWLPAATLRAQWQALLGSRAPGAVTSMCGSGVTGCHNLLALELAGLGGGQLYAGSFSEWIRDPARPVASGGAAAE